MIFLWLSIIGYILQLFLDIKNYKTCTYKYIETTHFVPASV